MIQRLEWLSKVAGYSAAFLVFLLSFLVAYDALMRYLFAEGSIALQELEWHLFDLSFLFGLSYSLQRDAHVRVDILFERFSPDAKAVVQIVSMLLLVIPFSLFFTYDAYAMTLQSYLQQE
ncbi:MAG TPA: TRAP transporter small permease subunit, partial [Epsilonproteobacteria bacterium]|nr:TRAP transporter small permease subunit [Campylobacterota bacterium]